MVTVCGADLQFPSPQNSASASATENFDTYRNLQPHRAVLPAIAWHLVMIAHETHGRSQEFVLDRKYILDELTAPKRVQWPQMSFSSRFSTRFGGVTAVVPMEHL